MEKQENRSIFTLEDVCRDIASTISARYPYPFWVKAEMHKLNLYPGSGHCFPDLLQKRGNEIVAEMRAIIWKSDYERIKENFHRVVKEPLKEGVEILFSAMVQYHPKYGISLRILDIDPDFTLGTLQRERRLCEDRLKKEGLWGKNRGVYFPLLPARIAMISASTSKGYSDFMKVLYSSSRPYAFHVELFPALLQGEGASQSILRALGAIEQRKLDFDIVVIVRGGGGDVGLNAYNHFDLCKAVCQFPLPVLSGVGHSTNQTVMEENAYFNAITPTELAYYILSYFQGFETSLQDMATSLVRNCTERLRNEHDSLRAFSEGLRSPLLKITYQKANLEQIGLRIPLLASQCIMKHTSLLKELETALKWMDPERLLEKGYTLTYCQGKLISGKDASWVPPLGSILETRVCGGRKIISKVADEQTVNV